MYRFALALALIVAAAQPAAALTPACPDILWCPLGDASTCPPDKTNCCPLPTGRRRRLNFGKSDPGEPGLGCCAEDCDLFLD